MGKPIRHRGILLKCSGLCCGIPINFRANTGA